MLFDSCALCHAAYLREYSGSFSLQTPAAVLHIVLVSRGSCTALSAQAQNAYMLCAGELLVLADAATLCATADCHLLCAGLSGSTVQGAAIGLNAPVHTNGSACPHTAQHMAALLFAMQHNADAPAQHALAFQLLISVARADEVSETPRLSPLSSAAVLAIRNGFSSLYGIDELSTQLGVSKGHLIRTFRAELGVSPGQYLTQVRLEAARALLAQRQDTLEVVAALCGFSCANYFCKVFKRHTGVSPAVWRTLHSHEPPNDSAFELLERLMYT